MIFKEFVKVSGGQQIDPEENKTVVCIDNDTLLVIGNKYKVHNEDSFSYLITGEYNDIKVWMMKSLFVTLDEYRDKQINSLLES
jgi:hypothetical protein